MAGTNGYIHGRSNGRSNGFSNGYSNGHSNGHSDGYKNGQMKREAAAEFWKKNLSAVEPCYLNHLTSITEVKVPERYAQIVVDSQFDLSGLRRFCDEHETSIPVVLQVAWAIVLGQYMGIDTVTLGSVTQRDGDMMASICSAEWTSDGTTVAQLVETLQASDSRSVPYQHVSLSEIQSWSDAPTEKICDTMVLTQFLSNRESALGVESSGNGWDNNLIVVNACITEDTAGLILNYATPDISATQARSLAGSLALSLEAVLRSSSSLVSKVNLRSQSDQKQFAKWNSEVPETVYSCMHTLFEERARLQPNAQAAVGFGGSLTFKELNDRAELLGSHLRSLGVGPETYVPFSFDKSTLTITAMLAVLKAGGACVALNPTHPIKRLQIVLQKCDARVVLTDRAHCEMFDGIVENVVVVTPEMIDGLKTTSVLNPPKNPAGPENPAFVVFTSGSTGEPKGIVLEHRALCTSMKHHGAAMRLNINSRSLQFAAYTFDVSIGEIFTTLLHGGCVCVPSDEERMSDLAGVIRRLQVNWAYLTPTVASLLDPKDVPSLKTLSLGGEAVKQENIKTWADHVYLINIYGPAETTIWSTGLVNLTSATPATNIGVGLGALMWVTDPADTDRLLPIGAIGEIVIEGPIVARGYLKDKQKTDDAFIEDPAWVPKREKVRRMYRSADLGYFNADGTLSFVGRRDNQVKMYGQRIEMGEIEHHLRKQCPNMKAGLVEMIKPKAQNEQPALAAFLCFDYKLRGADSDDDLLAPVTEELRSVLMKLKESLGLYLPSYMVPSLYIPLIRMPTSVSGKLDRRRLRDLAADLSREAIASYSLASMNKKGPTSANEEVLHSLWAQILNVHGDAIGVEDSFFQLGGDSIAAMKLVTAARKSGLALTVSQIFRQPVLSDMAETAKAISEEVEKDIEPFALLKDVNVSNLIKSIARESNINPSEIQDIYPCTPLQEGLMAITQKEPGTYIYQNVYNLPKTIDLARFRKAWELAVQTIDILRITIVPTDVSGTCQVVTSRGIDWQSPSNVEKYLKSDSHITMQYGDPLTRYAIVEGEEGNTFIWTAHHAVYDGWSLPMLLNRVEEIYKADGRLELPNVQFQHFIRYLSSLDSSRSDAFWKSKLSGSTPPKFPQLPSHAYQPRVNKIFTYECDVSRPESLEITMSTIIKGAWSILMSQYSDAGDDVVFGVTTTGRNADVTGVSEIIAPTITTIPVRVQIDRAEQVISFLDKIQTQATDTIPFEHAGLQNIAKINNECRMACSFQNLLVVQPEEDERNTGALGMKSTQPPAVGIYTYALVIQCLLRGNKIKIQVDYDDHVLSSSQVDRVCYQLEHIISQLCTNLDKEVGEINLFSDRDMAQVLEWNQNFPYVETRTIHDIVHEQVVARPDAPAICSWDGDFTYNEVEQLSNRFARQLVDLGVGPETLVPYCFNKSAWTIIAMMSIIKAGGACVALDPAHPPDRLETIITEAGAKLVVTMPQHYAMFKDLVPTVVTLSEELVETLPSASTPLPPRAQSNNPVFVLFTSGSTGKPKGIVIEHGMFASSAAAHSEAFGIGPDSRVLQFAAYTFDVSVGDIFTSLMRGACICVPSDIERMNNIAGAINRMNVNYTFLTPTVANLLHPSQVPSLRRLTLGGEASTHENIRTWADSLDLIICYGPAECSVYCSANPPAKQTTNPAVLGKAVGALIWVVDPSDHNKLSPVGCVGELVVQGPTVARGYLNEPEKTRDAFIHNPTWMPARYDQKYRRIYKTGDLARYNPDGTLSFVARKDTQVKVRGQRVELAEIEVHLSRSPEIKHAMLAVPGLGRYKGRLTCALSFQELSEHAKNPSDIEVELIKDSQKAIAGKLISTVHDRLTEKLPPYMIPAVWVVMRNIPLNASGKMNRKVVKTWLEDVDDASYRAIADIANTEAASQPTNEIEEKIQTAFSKTLNLPADQIGTNTSFLSLGGDSISAMQVMSRLRANNIRVTVQDILRFKTIQALSIRVQRTEYGTGNIDAHAEVLDEPFDLAPIQKLFFEMQPDGQNHFNQSFVVKLAKRFPAENLKSAIQKIVEQHSMLRSRFAKVNGIWKQRIVNDVSGSFLFLPCTSSSRQDMIESFKNIQEMLNIEQGPIMAGTECVVDDIQYLFLTVHHLAVDLVSWRVILQDLEEILVSGKVQSSTSMSFQVWSNLQREYASQNLSASNVLDVYNPPADFAYWGMSTESNTWGDITEASFTLDVKRTSLLLGDAHKALRTQPVEVMIAALIHSFQTVFTDRSLPAVYLEGHGREPWTSEIDLTRTIGWFTTMYPVSYNSSTDNWIDALKHTKDARRKIPANGWEYFTARQLNDNASKILNGTPMEIVFNYLGLYQQFHREDALLQDAEISPTECNEISSKMQRYSLFEISAGVERGCMKFSFEFNKKMKKQPAIFSWLNEYQKVLETGIDMLMQEAEIPTLSDFPMLSISYAGLEKLFNDVLPGIGVHNLDQVESILPASPMQLGILVSQLRSSAGDYEFYTILEATSIGNVEKKKLLDSWQQVVDRHSALRTIFIPSQSSEGLYDQVVLKNMPARITEMQSDDPVRTLKELPAVKATESKVAHQLTVCETSAGQLFVRLEINHALIDGTSMATILSEIQQAYEGKLSPVPALPYTEYVSFLRQQKKEPSTEYWREYLKDIQQCSFPRLDDGRENAHALKSVNVELPQVTRDSLQTFSDRYGITFANVVQSAWALVLRVFTNSDNVCYGYLTSGRDAPLVGIEEAVGPFINMLICRVDFNGTEPATRVMEKVQQDFLQSMTHQYVSLAEIQQAIGMSGQRLFNTAMSFQRYASAEPGVLTLKPVYDYDPTEFDITVNVATNDAGVEIDLTFWTSKLSCGQAENLANTYATAINALLASPEELVSNLNLVSPRDVATMKKWNSKIPETIDRCIHDVISQRAQERPNAPAVTSWDVDLTYSELDKLTTRLAKHLIQYNIKPDEVIPLCFEHSINTVVAMIAVLKAGGGFVLLDPKHPKERLLGLLEDVNARFIVAAPQTAELCQQLRSDVCIVSHSMLADLPLDDSNIQTDVTPQNIFYVQFTSGSTGKPKGVVMEHAPACSSIEYHGKAMRYGPNARVYQFSSYTFDAVILEVFTTLYHGGCICVPSEEERLSHMKESMNRMKINLMFMTPTLIRLFQPEDLPTLETLMLGGEPIAADNISTWGDKVNLIGGYGPAECCVYCCYNPLSETGWRPEVIGYPVGSALWLVDADDHTKLVPVGTVGELVVHGPIVGRGYLNDKVKTEAAFISTPSWMQDYHNGTQRLYKTGDLARYNSDGTLTIVGRKDTQVKLNGQRIELGEIESTIKSNYPKILHIAVDAIKPSHTPGRKLLSAFLDFGDAYSSSSSEMLLPMTDELRSLMFEIEKALSQRLPPYMVPRLWFPLKMPMSNSGKTERKVLHQICGSLSESLLEQYALTTGSSKRAASTEMEKRLEALWAKVLNAKKIGADDSFFRIGGDSIASMNLVSAARADGLALTVTDIFSHPVLSDMALIPGLADNVISETNDPEPFSLVGGVEAAKDILKANHLDFTLVEDIYPTTPLQEGLMALTMKEPDAYVYRAAYKLPSELDVQRLREAYTQVAQMNATLRTVFVPSKNHGMVQVVQKKDIEWNSSPSLDEYLQKDALVDMTYGSPLSRYAITEDGHFVWTAHHSIYDGWSMRLMLDQVQKVYEGLRPPTAAPFTRFIDFLSKQDLAASDEFWKAQFAGFSPVSFPQLPSAFYQPQVNAVMEHKVDNILYKSDSDITPSTILSAAWALTVGQLSDSKDVVFGMTRSGRNVDVAGISDIMGPTLTTVPLRIFLDANLSIEKFLHRVQMEATKSIPFEHVGLQRLRRLDSSCQAACDFKNIFVVQPSVISEEGVLGTKRVELPQKGLHTYALAVECIQATDGSVTIRLEYDNHVLPAHRTKWIASQLENAIRELSDVRSGRSLGEIEVFSPEDEARLRKWNSSPYPEINRCLQDIIKDHVTSSPNSLAVVSSEGTNFTFSELDRISDGFAWHLSSFGVKRGDIVPICFEKSAWVVVAMIAILKNGGAFVCLDPAMPVERMHLICEEVAANLVITSSRTSALFSNGPLDQLSCTVVELSEALKEQSRRSSTTFKSRSTPQDLMYLIFTSGSTGKPKGVMIEHAAACSSMTHHGKEIGFNKETRMFQFSSLTFDASIYDIFTTMCNGGCVCIPTEEERQGDVIKAMNNLQVNATFLTPTMARLFRPEDIPTLKLVTLGGEAVGHDNVETWAHKVRLVSGYGPSEASMCSQWALLTPGCVPENIGYPVGCFGWITMPDDHNRLAPIGSIGELVIQGPILARGYFKDEKKTSEAFIENPNWLVQRFGQQGRIYKTGDLVQYAEDGTMNFIGRKDTQVKLHGQRIELAEIDHHFWAQPEVEHSTVLLPKEGYCKERLVAVMSLRDVVRQTSEPKDLQLLSGELKALAIGHISKIRSVLTQHLPSYMVPTIMVVVEKLPTNSAGKTDTKLVRKWIEELDEQTYYSILDLATSSTPITPSNETEQQVQEIYSQILNLPISQVALDRSFVSLGGDSITAMQAISKMRAIGLAVNVKDILRSESIQSLAAHATVAVDLSSDVVEQFDTLFELSPIQQLFLDRCMDKQVNHFNQSFTLALKTQPSDDDLAFAFKEITNKHSMLHARFERSSSGKWMQMITSNIERSYSFGIHKVISQSEIESIVACRQKNLDITHGPLFGGDLILQDGYKPILFLVAHHFVVDLVSWRIILQDLEDCLKSRATIARKPFPFQRWCELQATYCKEQLHQQQTVPFPVSTADTSYWGVDSATNTYDNTTTQSIEIDLETTKKLLTGCHGSLNTEAMDVILSALLHSFGAIFKNRTLPSIFTEGHGREPWDNAIDISSTVGWFTTIYPVTSANNERSNMINLVKKVKDDRRSIANNGWSYFVSTVLGSLSNSVFPVEIMFNYFGNFQQLDREDGLFQAIDLNLSKAASDLGEGISRLAIFEISGEIMKGSLRLSFMYNKDMKHQDLVSQWIQSCQTSLVNIVEVLGQMSPTKTLCDYPLLSLTYTELDELVKQKLPEVGIRDLANVEDIFPCSPMQEGLLLAQNKAAGRYETYIVWELCSKHGTIDVQKLSNAWEAVVNRHQALRTIFIQGASADNTFVQLVFKELQIKPTLIEAADEAGAERLWKEPAATYNTAEPCHRLIISRTPSGKVFGRLDIHHGLFDGASMGVLIKDLSSIYGDETLTVAPKYGDYIAYLRSLSREDSLNFWKEYLDGLQPCFLPNINEDATGENNLNSLEIQVGDIAEIKEFCSQRGLTISNVLQTAWALVLRSYTSTDDVCFGYLTQGRDIPLNGIHDAVGPFINMLVSRVKLNEDRHLIHILKSTQEDFINSLSFQHCSLAEIQHTLNLSGEPLFNSALSLQYDTRDNEEEPALVFNPLGGHDPTEYDIGVNIGVSEHNIKTRLAYWTKALSHTQAQHVLDSFVTAVQAIIRQPDVSLREVNLTPVSVKEQLRSWMSTPPQSVRKCIHDLIEDVAIATPNSPAIASVERTFTYSELNVVTTKFAHYLRSQGVGAEDIVPVCFSKSPYAIVATLSILKAGGACVALDPKHPIDRIQGMISDCKSNLILAAPEHAERFTGIVNKVVKVNESLLNDLPSDSRRLDQVVGPDNAAFIVFTSGSTGKPKGIVVEHKNYSSVFTSLAPQVGMGPGTRTLQYASYTFDVSIGDTYITLTHGGCICVPTEEERMNDLDGFINRMNVNWANITPSVASLLQPTDVPSLKVLRLGGEPLSRDIQNRWAPQVRLMNSYGPAEASVWTCSQELSVESSPTNLGRGFLSRLWITEPSNHNRLVPIGCVGELVIQGPNVARGYLNDEQKTKEAFIDNPTWLLEDVSDLPRRVYKTGDLVRQSWDGHLEFVGRKDTQVKFHGQRVEVGEIEYQIRSGLPSDATVVVELIEPLSQNKRQILAAFIAFEDDGRTPTIQSDINLLKDPSDEFAETVRHLESSLADSLPQYMIPSLYLNLVTIPKNASMKIDRKALRVLGSELSIEQINKYSFVSGQKRAPETPMEKQLHKVWVEVLKLPVDAIGAEDNFFRIGGDSISAMHLVSAARKAGLSLTVANIFQSSTLSEMAAVTTIARGNTDVVTTIEPFSLLQETDRDAFIKTAAKQANTTPESVQDIMPVTPIQQALIALTVVDPGLYVLQAAWALPKGMELEPFQRAWESVVAEIDSYRTRLVHFDQHGTYQVILRADASPVRWRYASDLDTYLRNDNQLKFGYGVPLARFAIVKEPHRTCFVWSAHHSVYDAWSLSLTWDLFVRRYQGLKTAPVPPFNRFISYGSKVDPAATRDYWVSKFTGCIAPEFPRLPHGQRARTTGTAAHSISLLTKPDSGVTVPNMLRAAWALTIGSYTGSEDVVYGQVLSGRNAPVPGVTDMIAPLLTTVPVRVDLNKQKTVYDLLQEIQSDSIAMIPHEQAGLQTIAKYSPECAQATKFQTMLVIQSPRESASRDLALERVTFGYLDNIPSYGLVLECEAAENSIVLNAGYDPSALSAAQMDNLLRQLEHIFYEISKLNMGSTKIQDLQLVGPHGIEKLKSWNKFEDDRVEKCAHHLIHERALSQPNNIAVDSSDLKLTYGQLDELSTNFAHYLRSLGAGPEKITPLLFEKTPWAIVSMVAAMKTGGAFVFLDPKHPLDRLSFIIQQVSASFVVTTPDLEHVLHSTIKTIPVSDAFFQSLPAFEKPPVTDVTPRNTIYVIFTSGSTGLPKGCVIEHSSFLSGAVHHAQRSELDSNTRIMQMAPFTFDASILETVTGLLSGACICLPGEKQKGLSVSEIINEFKINWTFLTPSVARTLNPDDVPTLKVLILGGEALSKVDIELWSDKVHLINGYGPSECSVAVAGNTEITSETDPADIGSKMACSCWVVDPEDHNLLLPIGSVGELIVEGPIVARGYLNEPEKTAAAFINDPKWLELIGDDLHARFYKTGDLVCFNDDGTIHFIGRKDTQVKLRGQRIELGEIEHQTSVHPAVKHAMVALPRSGRYKESLVAVLSLWDLAASSNNAGLVPISGDRLDSVTATLPYIRQNLQQHLPSYMLPSTFIVVDDLPMLPSGKIDRTKIKKWLESMDNEMHELVAAQAGGVASHTASLIDKNDTVALIISERVTQLLAADDESYAEAIRGRNVSLITAGLNSISVVSLSAFIKEQFSVSIPVAKLMDITVTVEGLARMIETAKSDPSTDSSPEINLMNEFTKVMEDFDNEAATDVRTLNPSKPQPETVLLTGATGFLGTRILQQLMENPNIKKVVALVRAPNVPAALERVTSSAATARWWQEKYASRLAVWIGDLSKPMLGLSRSRWACIEGRSRDTSSNIDAIIHNGAVVHWGVDFAGLKAANISSTVSLLAALTRSASPPRLIFVSGGAVFPEDADDNQRAVMVAKGGTGYAQAKFVADLAVKEFARRYSTDIARIIKPGLICGTADAGISNTDDFFWRVVASAVDIGAYNNDEPNAGILIAGADQVASVLLDNVFSTETRPIETNLRHGITAGDLWNMLNTEFGYGLRPLSSNEWLEMLQVQVREKGDSHRLWPVLHFLEAGGGKLGGSIDLDEKHREGVKSSLRGSIKYMQRVGYMLSKDREETLEQEVVFGRSGTRNMV